MLYSQLRICKIYKEEIESLKKLKQKAAAGDALTEAGLRQRHAVPQIEAEIQAVTAAYKKCVDFIMKDERFQAMNPDLQKICKRFYFENDTVEKIEEELYTSNIIRSLRQYCHKF